MELIAIARYRMGNIKKHNQEDKEQKAFDLGKLWNNAGKTALNIAEETVRTKLGSDALAMALATGNAHSIYWQHKDVLNAILGQLVGDEFFASVA